MDEDARPAILKTCVICADECSELHPCCEDTGSAHLLCTACFIGYCKAELAPQGAYEGIRSGDGLVSPSGALPCPLFITGDCNTAAIPLTTLFGGLHTDPEAAKLYYLAVQRVVFQQQQQAEAAAADAEDSESESDQQNEVIEAIRVRVLKALERGAVGKCPQCLAPGIKNDACIHMTCHICACRWCYCCGHTRDDCRGCDTIHPYLERQPNWDTFGIGEETAARGALHEFHRQRQAYFVKHEMNSTTPYEWQAFVAAYPDILTNVPTLGRRITWRSLESHVIPPVFGSTTEEDLRWAHRPRARITEHIDQEQESVLRTIQPPAPPETVLMPLSDVLRSDGGKYWLLFLVILIPMHCVSWIQSLGLTRAMGGVTSLFSFGFFFFTAKFALFRLADYCEVNPGCRWTRYFPDVQLVGRRREADGEGEGPYYSASGRFRNERNKFAIYSVLYFAMGCFMLSLYAIYKVWAFVVIALIWLVHHACVTLLTAFILNICPLPPLTQGHGGTAQAMYLYMNRVFWYRMLLVGVGAGLLISRLFALGLFFVMFGFTVAFAVISPHVFSNNFWQGQLLQRRQRHLFTLLGIFVMSYCLLYYFAFTNQEAVLAVVLGPLVTVACLGIAFIGEARQARNNNVAAQAGNNRDEEQEADEEEGGLELQANVDAESTDEASIDSGNPE